MILPFHVWVPLRVAVVDGSFGIDSGSPKAVIHTTHCLRTYRYDLLSIVFFSFIIAVIIIVYNNNLLFVLEVIVWDDVRFVITMKG